MFSKFKSSKASHQVSAPTDDELIRAVAGEDRRAFEVLYRRYHPRLLGFVKRWLTQIDQAEEVVQEVLFVVWKDAVRFRAQSRVSTWIFGIAYRQSMKALGNTKALGKSNVVSLSSDGDLPEIGAEDNRLGNRELRLSLDAALTHLSPEHRTVLELTFYEECSYREIASILGCPLNTVKTRTFHAREQLRRILPRLGWSAL